jgi:hypothetical protein
MEWHDFSQDRYGQESLTAIEAQQKAQEIAFAPILFQVSRLMIKLGIFELLDNCKDGVTLFDLCRQVDLSHYAGQVLLESSLTAGTVLCREERFFLSKTGWFLLHDASVRVNMDFVHDVNYEGMFSLEEALRAGKPAGLKVFGQWKTIYEGLSQLPAQVQKSWFGFDHFYSDASFDAAGRIIFAQPVRTLLDVGGNTGRFAAWCASFSETVAVTVMDLPPQLELLRRHVAQTGLAERILGYAADLLDEKTVFPTGFDVIWMSQFLDCFSADQVIGILRRAAEAMTQHTRLYIMETLWDRQRFEAAAFSLAQISLYFTVMANGNSKMFSFSDLRSYIEQAGLSIVRLHDGLGWGHTLLEVGKKEK